MKINFYHKIVLTFLSFLLCLTPVLAQSSYQVTIKNPNGSETIQSFNSSNNINQLVDNIYQRIKPPANFRPPINIELGSISLNEFQNLVESKGVSTTYYKFSPEGLTFKDFGDRINSSSIRSPSENYGVILSKSGYDETNALPFKVIQITDNTPVLLFSISEVVLKDATRISLILDTGNSGLDGDQIVNALNSKDYRLSPSSYDNLQAYHDYLQDYQSCQEYITRNPMVQRGCGEFDVVDYLISINKIL